MGLPKRPKAAPVAVAPEAPPDLATKAVQDAAAAERRRQQASAGRKSTFLTGALGDTSPVSSTLKRLLGS
jgi:hypothetical protein